MASKRKPPEVVAESRKKSNANLKPELSKEKRIKSGRQAVEMGRKGGKKSQQVQRETRTIRQMLEEVMSYKPMITPFLRDGLIKQGMDPDRGDYTAAYLGVVALQQKVMRGDARALQMQMEILGQDPKVLLEREKLALERESLQQGVRGYSALDEAFAMMHDGSDDQ